MLNKRQPSPSLRVKSHYLLFGTLRKISPSCLPCSSLWSLTALNSSWQTAIWWEHINLIEILISAEVFTYARKLRLSTWETIEIYSNTAYDTSSTFTVSTGGTLEILFLFLPLPGVEEEASSRSPPPLTLLEGEVALLLLELADIAGWFNNKLAR